MIRYMKPEDTEEVYSILSDSLDQYFAPAVLDFFLVQWPKGQLVFCDFAGNIQGFLCGLVINGNIASIPLFAVRRECRSRGIGKSLLDSFRTESVFRGCSSIVLEVREENTRAIKFYERNGFVKTDLLIEFYDDQGNAVRMTALPRRNT